MIGFLDLIITEQCNSRCKICSIWSEGKKTRNELSIEDIKEILESNAAKSVKCVDLSGGEPFLRKDLVDIIKLIKKYLPNSKISISTNGMDTSKILSDLEKISEICDIDLRISLDGLEETHNIQRGSNQAFNKTMNTIKEINKKYKYQHLTFLFVATPINYKDMLNTRKLVKSINTNYTFLATIGHEVSNYKTYQQKKGEIDYKERFKFSDKEKEELKKEFEELCKEYIKENDFANAFFISKMPEYIDTGKVFFCDAPENILIVLPSKLIYNCIMMDSIGNLKEGLDKVITSKKADHIKKICKEGKCPGCMLFMGSHISYPKISKLFEDFYNKNGKVINKEAFIRLNVSDTDKTNKKKIMHISSLKSHPCFTELVELQREQDEIRLVKLELCENPNGERLRKNYEIDEISNSYYITIKNVKKIIDQDYDIKLRDAFNTLLKKHKPDIIHIHVFSGISLLPILNAASSLGIRKVLTLNDHSLFCINGSCLKEEIKCELKSNSLKECDCISCKRFAQKNSISIEEYNTKRIKKTENIINQCDKIICPSKHQKKVLTNLFGENPNIVPLYYGLNLPPSSNKNKKKSSKIVFGFLGMIWKAKGIHLIEQALDNLKDYDFEVLMGLIYESNLKSNRDALERIRSHDKIRLKTNIGREVLYDDFFSNIDYLIIPSIWNETGPMTLFEAFHYKVPVIIFDNESMKEKIKENKSSLVFRDKEELIKILKGIIKGEIKKKENDNFPVKDINTYAKEIESIYKDIVARPHKDLSLRLGFQCNQNCIFCVVIDMVKAINFSEEPIEIEKLENDLRKYRKEYDIVELSGGEPTIRKDFFRIVELAHKLGYQIELVTNGRMLSYEKFCSKLINYNLRLIMVCLHSANPKIHDATTCVKGSFNETVKCIKNLRRLGIHSLGQILITKSNYKTLLDITKLMVDTGINDIRFTFLCPNGNAESNFDILVPKYKEVTQYVTEAVSWLHNKNINVDLKTFPYCCVDSKFRKIVADEKMITGALTYGKENVPFYISKVNRATKLKEKFDICKKCSYEPKCEGVWKNYVAHYGKEEFKPIK